MRIALAIALLVAIAAAAWEHAAANAVRRERDRALAACNPEE